MFIFCEFELRARLGEATKFPIYFSFETAVFFIATHGCQNCQSINDMMGLFNSLHSSFVVSLPSVCKRLVLDGYKKHKERLISCQECFSLYLL